MASTGMSAARSARPPGTDWEDSFFRLDNRHRQLQERFNEQEEELKRLRVAQRKAQSQEGRRSIATARGSLVGQSGSALTGGRPPAARPAGSREYVSLPSPSTRQANEARASALHATMAIDPDPGAALPDPAMIWGAEGSVQNYIAANALYHANEELRRKLSESSTLVQALQTELSASRTLCTNAQSRIQDLAQQMHQLVRERDLAAQKLAAARQSISDFERTLQARISEEEQTRFRLEGQMAELRSRLVVGTDSNELLSRDVRALLRETKEKTSEVVSLRSKLALAEAGLSSQRNTNENLLLELTSLNSQLVEERKRALTAAREAHSAALVRDRVADLEERIRSLTQERAALESSRTQLTGDLVRVTEDALRHARSEVRADLDDWRTAAAHWEEIAQLLYRDVSQRTSAHLRCRAECDEAKAARDAAGVELRTARDALTLCRAKLDIVWPTHERDTEGLTAEEVAQVFCPRARGDRTGAGADGDQAPMKRTGPADAYAEALKDLPPDATSGAERIHELQEANAALVAELEQMKLTGDLLQERLAHLTGRERQAVSVAEAAAREVASRERAGQRLLARQMGRVQFLEAQVRSLRGYQVGPGTAIQDVAAEETVLELFLGQLVAAEAPEQMSVPEAFRQLFCSADFLLHETVTTPTITGLNGFFDTTASFQIAMDALLLYYLQTRRLLIQLHRVCDGEEVAARVAGQDTKAHAQAHSQAGSGGGGSSGSRATSSIEQGSHGTLTLAQHMYETVAEGAVDLFDIVALPTCLDAARPTLRGHVRLRTPGGRHVASLEFQLTARTPFTETFKQLAREAVAAGGPRESELEESETTPIGQAAVAVPPTRQATHTGARGGSQASDATSATRSGVHEWMRRASRPSSSPAAAHDGVGTSSLESSSRPLTPDTVRRGARGARYACLPPPSPSPARPTPRGVSPPLPDVHRVAVDVVRLELPADLPTPIPRLSCIYALPALQKEVHLPAPDRPRYTIEYAQPSAGVGAMFDVRTPAELAALAREPVSFFLVDEDAPAGGPQVWAVALCEWGQALASPGQEHSLSLALLRQSQTAGGGGGRDMVRGAVLRVRLVAFTSAEPRPPAGPVEGLAAAQEQQRPLDAPQRSPQPQPQLQHVITPSPLTALQQLMQRRGAAEGVSHTSAAAGPSAPSSAQAPTSMAEEMMALEYGRLMRK